jgi:TldD protein
MERRDFVKRTALAAGGVALARPMIGRSLGARRAPPPRLDASAKELLLEALDAATAAGAEYADGKVGLYRDQRIGTREMQITYVNESSSLGLGVRALVNGSWGFAATPDLTVEAATRAGRSAAAIAKANSEVEDSVVRLAPVESYGDVTWTSPYEIDPWDVPIEDKVDRMLEMNRIAMGSDQVRFVSSSHHFVKVEKTIATTDGTVATQTLVRCNPGMSITAISEDRSDFQTRNWVTYPAGRGYEYVLQEITPEKVEQWAAEAAQKLSAVGVEPGKHNLVLHPTHLWLTIHESIGHPTELDRAEGYEANYAGTSFLAPPSKVLNRLRYGPEFMQLQAERTTPGGLASTGWDAEGVKADQWMIIEDGIFVDYQTTREQVSWISKYTGVTHSHGCAHSDSWSSIPFQRMPNMNLLPGEEDLSVEDVIAATDDGIYIEGRSSYSIDQQRYNFQFSGQVAWEVKGGKKTRMLRDVAYQATTEDFWNSMDMIGGPSTYMTYGSFYDGKGQPGQSNPVSHGCPVARFSQINVLNTGRSG